MQLQQTLQSRTLKRAWALFDAKERRDALKLLAVMFVGAFASAAMVASIYPFLAVLSNPGRIVTTPALDWAYGAGGFHSAYGFLIALGWAAIAVIMASNVILIFSTWAGAHYTEMRKHSISRRLLSHYLAQPYTFFIGQSSGDMATNILSESQQAVQIYLAPLAQFASAALTVVAVLITLFLVNPLVASVTITTFGAIYGAIMLAANRYVRRMGRSRAQANTARFRITAEAFGGIKDVKLLGREAAYVDRFSTPSVMMARSQIGVSVLSQAPRYAVQIVAFGGVIVLSLILLDPAGVQRGKAVADIVPLVGLMAFAGQRLLPELQKLHQSLTEMTAGSAAVDRVYDDLHCGTATVLDRSTPAPLRLRRTLELESVRYTYPAADRAGLADVTLCIKAGERIGVVGASGAGKTTLADVILGLLAPEAGEIRTDGVPITFQNLRAWQRSVGYVPQDIFLTNASLADNIALGLPPDEIDLEKVERSARIAQLHSFITTELPQGYATHIGDRGVRLSGGQRQRIGIARALYQDADLIVFDEATSALDNLTEREVMEAIDGLPGDKTILMIAHRLSTVKVCDRIIVMEGGRLAGVGSWSSLIAHNATFRALAHAAYS